MHSLLRASFAGAAAMAMATVVSAAMPTSTYLAKAGAGDLYEIKSSELLETSTTDASLKGFAQQMIADHRQSTADVKAAALQSGLHPNPPMLSPKQKGDLAALARAHGTARDRLYVSQQKMAHQEALALHQDYASSGDKPALRTTAGQIVPVVQHHIAMLDQMAM